MSTPAAETMTHTLKTKGPRCVWAGLPHSRLFSDSRLLDPETVVWRLLLKCAFAGSVSLLVHSSASRAQPQQIHWAQMVSAGPARRKRRFTTCPCVFSGIFGAFSWSENVSPKVSPKIAWLCTCFNSPVYVPWLMVMCDLICLCITFNKTIRALRGNCIQSDQTDYSCS